MKKTIVLKKAMALILALFTVMTTMVAVPLTASAVEPDFTIGTADELVAFKQAIADGTDYAGKLIQLTADIDMSGVDNWPNTNKKFNGTFDGAGHAIKNLSGSATAHEAGLLFGMLGNATVQNLVLKNCSYTGSKNCMGLIAGNAQDGAAVLKNLYVDGMVTQYWGADSAILLGRIEKWSAETSVTIENCVVAGSLSGSAGDYASGNAGFVGRVKNSTLIIKDCAFVGSVTTTSSIGNVAAFQGYNQNGTVNATNCINMGILTAGAGTIGSCDSAIGVVDITAENFFATLEACGDTWTQTGETEMMPASVAAMIGKTYTPSVGVDVTIGTPADLLAFKQAIADGTDYAGKLIQLTADIDMSGVDNWPNTNKKFNGIFDGAGHAIKNLSGSATANEAGLLFGMLGSATVQNLILENCSYTGSKNCMGLIAGNAQDGTSTLKNLYVQGAVTQSWGADSAILLGRIEKWSAETSVTIENCVVAGSLSGSASSFASGNAGFVGRVKNSTLIIKDCAFVGSVTTTSNIGNVAAFQGCNENGTVNATNCINMGILTAGAGTIGNCDSAIGVVNITAENFSATLEACGDTWTQTGKTEMMPAAVAKLLGKAYIPTDLYYQCGTTLNEDGTVDVRFITVIDSLAYAQVGFNITISRTANGNTETSAKIPFTTTTVYESITALGETVTAEELGGKYIVAVVVKGIDCANYTHEFAVEAFVKDTLEGAATITASGVVSVEKGLA